MGSVGSAFGGPSGGLTAQFKRLGFADTKPAWCIQLGVPWDRTGPEICMPELEYPRPVGGGSSLGFAARYAVSPTWSVGVGFGETVLGGSSGHAAGPKATTMFSYWDVWVGWISALWKPRPFARVGAGVGRYGLKHTITGEGPAALGLMGEAGLEWPRDRALFIDLSFRAHLIPPVSVDHGPEMQEKLRVSPSHAALHLGAGLRL